MRKSMYVLFLIAVLPLAFATGAEACGDKFLVSGPGVRYTQLHAAVHPSSVLLYRNPASELAQSVLGSDLEFVLELAGHSVKTVDSLEELEAALASGEYEVVMADVDDAETVERGKAVVLPVATDAVAATMSARYDTVVASSNPPEQIVASIDRALEQRGGEE